MAVAVIGVIRYTEEVTGDIVQEAVPLCYGHVAISVS